MTDPIDLNARRDERVPEPEGEPAITMPMDSDQIIFRDQAALDDYVAGAHAALRAELDTLRDRVNAWEEAGYDLWRPYGDDCETCGTKWEASIVRPTVILDGSLTPVRGSDDE